jgi:2-methylisocitrate lyase-like PEP mutase family enzyme
MALSQQTKFNQFKALHDGPTFLIPNPWDAGTARILESLGFSALATTSAGFAFSAGLRDSQAALTRNDLLANAAEIVTATDLPVSADLENGFGDAPQDCADTITQALGTGLVGGSIEDASGDTDTPIYSLAHATDRIRAAAESAQGKPFLLTARAENFLWGRPDLNDTITRLQAFAEAGADVLYAPGLPDLAAIRTVCAEVQKPVNILMGLKGATYTVAELAEAGAARISVGGSFARAALGAMIRAATEIRDQGTFTYAVDAVPDAEVAAMMRDKKV